VQETTFWRSRPGQRERLAEAAAHLAEGRVYGEVDGWALPARLRSQL
jgi:hypothetical protein